jgi:G3E family GTPase
LFPGFEYFFFFRFLGSGKMNPILLLSKVVAQSGYRFAIVINEIGEIGIDNQLVTQNIHFYLRRGGVKQ